MSINYYIRDPAVVARQIGEETVLVPVRQNMGDLESIYTLNPVAAGLWNRLEQPQSIQSLAEALMDEYEVDDTQATADVAVFLKEMDELKLVDRTEHV